MSYDIQKQHRRSIRLNSYDYTQAGSYYITICTYNRESLFGKILDGHMMLNNLGEVVYDKWLSTESIRHNVTLDSFQIMPNHLHGIVTINNPNGKESSPGRGDPAGRSYEINERRLKPNSLGAIIGQFKSVSAKRINILRRNSSMPVWQRNYYEHVIRNEDDLNIVRQYIQNNPLQWDTDDYHPSKLVNKASQYNTNAITHNNPTYAHRLVITGD